VKIRFGCGPQTRLLIYSALKTGRCEPVFVRRCGVKSVTDRLYSRC